MNRIKEQSGTVSETFKVHFDEESTKAHGQLVYSSPSTLGWRFGLRYRKYSKKHPPPLISQLGQPYLAIFFDAGVAHRLLIGTNISVLVGVRREDTNSFEEILRKDGLLLTGDGGIIKIGSWTLTSLPSSLAFSFTVSWGLDGQSAGSQPDIPLTLRRTLVDSVSSGTFLDTRFFVFSRRKHSGTVDTPIPIFANSVLLKDKSSYFETLLSNESRFSESVVAGLDDGFPRDHPNHVDDYDYDADSDLEDSPCLSESRGKRGSPDQQGEDTLSVPDLDGSSDNETLRTSPLGRGESSRSQCESFSTDTARGVGRTVIVKDTALVTFRALIYYLYTGDIVFSSLRSDKRPTLSHLDNVMADAIYHPPTCSPKSMYRLADKLGLQELKELAFNAIRSSLSKDNIVEEAFSRFTSMYSEIQKMESDMLCSMSDSSPVKDVFPQMIERVADGDLPHAAGLLSSVFRKLVAAQVKGSD